MNNRGCSDAAPRVKGFILGYKVACPLLSFPPSTRHPLYCQQSTMSFSSSSTNPFMSSPPSSGYATAEQSSSPPSFSFGWGECMFGDEEFPLHLTHDEFAIVNPDF